MIVIRRSLLTNAIVAASFAFIFIGKNAFTQTNALVNEGSGPIVGAGHNYIYGVSETVIPSNGTVSLKIDFPTPKSRGLRFPFALTYNSGGAHRFISGQLGCGGLDSACATADSFYADRAHQGAGWTDTLPYATAVRFAVQFQAGTNGGDGGGDSYSCQILSSYNFFDMQGSSHPLGLAAVSTPLVSVTGRDDSGSMGCDPYHLQMQNGYGYQSSQSGGDDQIKSALTAGVVCDGQPTQSQECGAGPSFTVTDLDGTKYLFPADQVTRVDPSGQSTFNNFLFPSSVEDRNGNTIQLALQTTPYVSGGLPITDTVGRQVVSISNSQGSVNTYPNYGAATPMTYNIGGLNYKLAFTTTSASYTAASQRIINTPGTWYGCQGTFSVLNSSENVLQSVTAPNGTSYQFKYESTYGLLSEVDYPDGGWVKYTWKLSDTYSEAATFTGRTNPGSSAQGLCLYEYQTPVIDTRTIGYSSGTTAAQTQNYTYNTTWNSVGQWTTKTTTVLTTDEITGKQSKTIYSYGPVGQPIQVNEAGAQSQLPVETQVQHFDLVQGGSPVLLQTVTKTWADQYDMTSQQTQTAGGPVATEVYCYEANSTLVLEKDEYAFGAATPNLSVTTSQNSPWVAFGTSCGSPTPTRTTTYDYFITSAPCQVIVSDSNQRRVSETDAYLDGASGPCSSGGYNTGAATQGVSPLVSGTHDESNFGPSSTARRGNPTKIVKWLNTGTSITTTATYDETGQIVTSTDGCGNDSCSDMTGSGHTTTYSYADNFVDGGAAGSTNAYVTSITAPSPNGVPITTKYAYRYSDGQVSGVTDANNQTTTYGYADSLNRLTSIQGPPDPSNGNLSSSTAYGYVDGAPSPSVTTSEAINANSQKTVMSIMDGMGHLVGSLSLSDPSGAVDVDTAYNGMGEVYSVTNPDRSGSSAATTFDYDALGRKVLQTNADGSSQHWCYDGVATSASQTNCSSNGSSAAGSASWIDFSDETGSHWQHANDSFGRLVAVMEPSPSSGAPSLETDYGYDALDDLVSVAQRGVSGEVARVRGFTYDSLGRLVSSSNPETGTICYSQFIYGTCQQGGTAYDANGNLSFKTDARGDTTTYTYDTLNRLTAKARQGGSTDLYFYDGQVGQFAVPSFVGANVVGRLSFTRSYNPAVVSNCNPSSLECDDEYFGYDQAGRLAHAGLAPPSEWGLTIHNVDATYDLAGNMTDMVYPDGRHIKQTWNAAGQLGQPGQPAVQDATTGQEFLQSVAYNADGSPATTTLGNGIVQSINENSRLQIEGMTVQDPLAGQRGATYLSHTYCYLNCVTGGTANNGNIWGITDNLNRARTQGFTYDSLNRIASYMQGGVLAQQYAVDSFGNLGLAAGADYGPLYNTSNQVSGYTQLRSTSSSTPPLPVYDGSGNQIGDTDAYGLPRTLVFDAESRLAQIGPTGGAVSAVFTYDAGGNRIRKQNYLGVFASGDSFTEYAYFNGQPIAEKDQDGNWTDYVFASGKRIARVSSAPAVLHLHGIRDNSINMSYGVEGTVNGAVLGTTPLTLATGDRLSFDMLQTVNGQGAATYGGLALFHDSPGQADFAHTAAATDDESGMPLFVNSFTDGVWHHFSSNLDSFAGLQVTSMEAGIHAGTPAGTFDLYFANVSLVRADGTVISILGGQGTSVNNVSGNGGGAYAMTSGTENISFADQTIGTTFTLGDHLGSAQMEFASGGWPTSMSQFMPYGGEINPPATTNHYKFTGKERDAESGLDYFGARYYASSAGRWMSPDWASKPEAVPYSNLSDPQSLNLYTYVRNNPLGVADVDGHVDDYLAMLREEDKEAEYNRYLAGDKPPPTPQPAQQQYGRQADGSYKADPAKVKAATDSKTPIGNGQCVAACSRLSGVTPHTASWTPGASVLGLNDTTDVGLAIASFGPNGKFTQPGGDQNSAIYMGHDKAGNVMIVDQWPPPNKPQYNAPFEHPLANYGPNSTQRMENNASFYHVIVVP